MIDARLGQPTTYHSLAYRQYRNPLDFNYNAYTVTHTPTDGERPWGTPRPDADKATHIIKADAPSNGNSGGDVPFLDALDANKLNELIGTESGMTISLLGETLEPRQGNTLAVATVSPQGGFKQETLRRTWHNIRRPSISLPHSLPPLLGDTQMPSRSLHVATFYNTLIDSHNISAQNTARSGLGAMAAYHALRDLSSETTIQYAYLTDRIGSAYRSVLSQIMGLDPLNAKEIIHSGKPYAVSQGVVGKFDQQGTILHNLAVHIGETHQISL